MLENQIKLMKSDNKNGAGQTSNVTMKKAEFADKPGSVVDSHSS